MKVWVTDFDGTLYVEDSNVVTINENIAALELFKNEKDIYGRNNIVVVSTAREPKSIMKYINLFKIPCDYVISYMGALIWDCIAQKYIYANYFSANIAKKILNMVEPYLSDCRLEIYSNIENPGIDQHVGYVFVDEKNDVFSRMHNDFGRPLKHVKDYTKYYDEDFFTRCFPGLFFFINNTKNNKCTALDVLIEILLKKNRIDTDTPIYAIGDGLDDYETLKKYNGYRMEVSEKQLEEVYSKKIESVKKYVDMILDT